MSGPPAPGSLRAWAPRERRAAAIGMGAILIGAAATYALWLWPYGFVEDDFCWLEDARRSLSDPSHLFTLHISGFLRPVVHASFAVNYAVAGLAPLPYYLVNMLFELGCVVLLARLAIGCGLGLIPVLAATAAFAYHGTHHEIVGWVSGRTTSLWTLFGLASLVAWVNWRQTGRRGWYAAALACLAAALLSKEEAVSLLPILAAADWLICTDARRPAASRLLALLPHAVLTAAYLLLQWRLQTANLLVRQGGYGPHLEALANWLYRVPSLFLQFHVRGPLDAAAYSAGGLLLAWWLLRGASPAARRTALFGLLLILLALAPTASFRGVVPGVLASRYSYFASAGAALIVGAMAQAALARPVRRSAAVWATGGVVVLLLVTQHHRLRGGLVGWRDKASNGARLLAAFRQSDLLAALAAEPPRAIRVVDPPMGLSHLRSALWLAAGIDPDTVFPATADLPGDPAGGDRPAATIRWREACAEFERCAP